MINIFLSCVIVSFILIVYGKWLLNLFKEKSSDLDDNFSEYGLFGIIFVSFISLFANFFFPINILFNNLILITGLIYSYFNINFNKKFFCTIIISSFFSTLLIILNNVNRPDAGLYHLPYVSILNNEKIIIGLSNLHSRFGTISVIQYASSVFNNSLLNDNGVVIPLAFCAVFFLIYLTDKLFFLLNKKSNLIIFFFLFLLLIFSFYSFSNYSEYGNDVPAFIYFFLTIIIYLNTNILKNKFTFDDKKLIITSIFVVLNKVFFILIVIIPILIILKKHKIFLEKKFFSFFIILFLGMWFLKNILVSSCILYPIKITCIKNLSWYNEKEIINTHVSGEAWAKAWVDQDEPRINQEEYNKDFKWLKTWSKKHLKKINEKFTPFIIFNIIFISILFLKYPKKNIYFYKSEPTFKKTKIILLLSGTGVLFWFMKFPLYRYGAAYLACFICSVSVLILYFFNKKINMSKNLTRVIIFFSIFLFISFNIKRVIKNFDYVYSQYPWPKIYSFSSENIAEIKIPVKYNKKIIYYKSKTECMYTIYSPCTHEEKNINYKVQLGYKIFY
jgi:hypothetical protein